MSNFLFLQKDFPNLFEEARLAERNALMDARVSSVYARRTLEGMVKWLYANDAAFSKPYDSSLNGLMGSSSFEANVPEPVRVLAQGVRRTGNAGEHDARGLRSGEALGALRDLFSVLRWFAFTYRSDSTSMLPGAFDETVLPEPASSLQSSLQATQQLEAKLKAEFETQLETQRLPPNSRRN